MLKPNKKPAQHVVELAILAPFFIVLFGIAFQIMVEMYVKYRFSYNLNNAIVNTISSMQTYGDETGANNFDLQKEVSGNLNINGEKVVSLLDTGRMSAFLFGTFKLDNITITSNDNGLYFFSMVPINRAYVFPVVLDIEEIVLDEGAYAAIAGGGGGGAAGGGAAGAAASAGGSSAAASGLVGGGGASAAFEGSFSI